MNIKAFKPYICRNEMDSVLNTMGEDSIAPGKLNGGLSEVICHSCLLKKGAVLAEYGRAIEYGFECCVLVAGDKVAVSPLASRYYLDIIKKKKFIPVFVDTDFSTGCMAFNSLQQVCSDIKLIVLDSPLGVIPDYLRFEGLGIPILEDVSNSLGAGNSRYKAGTFGHVVVASFGYDKLFTAGGGAFVGVRDKPSAELFDNIVVQGGTDRLLSDINCALALEQFKKLDKNIAARRNLALGYRKAVGQTKHKVLLSMDESENSYYCFPMKADSSVKEIKDYAGRYGIEVASPFEDSIIRFTDVQCQNAATLDMQCLVFPMYANIGIKNGETVTKVLSVLP